MNTSAEELYGEAKDLLLELMPPIEHGENEDCERLWNILAELRDIAGSRPFEEVALAHLKFTMATFPKATAFGSLDKLKSEIIEVQLELALPSDRNIAEEYADCFMCLLDSATRAGLFLNEIINAMANKVVKNIGREWKYNEDGTYSHVKK